MRELLHAKSKGWTGPPFDPQILASLRGIRCKKSNGLFSSEAQLTPLPSRQLLLEFNPDRPAGRRNFSICHEIAHTFFSDCYEIVQHRRSNPTEYGAGHEVERLCQIGAAELLMPEAEFRRDLASYPFSLSSVSVLMDRYAASREAVIRRMVSLSKQACAAVFLSKRISNTERRNMADGSPVPKMRILYAVPSPTFSLFLPPNKSVPDGSCVYKANEEQRVVRQIERWEISGFGEWVVEGMALPVPFDSEEDIPTVAALVLAAADE